MPQSTTLSVRLTVPALVRVYEAAAADIRDAFAKIADAECRLNATFTMEEDACKIRVRDRHNHRGMDFDDPSGALELLKRSVWRALVERLELRRMLSVQRAKELDEQLERGELPEITEQNVFAFARFYSDHIDDMMGEAVTEVFEFLRPRNDHYKTNSELEIGPRVILTCVETWFSGGFHVRHWWGARLTAMENVFTALDGKGSVGKGYYSQLENAIKAAASGETEYFAYKCFKNGNLHLTFRRPDLLKKLHTEDQRAEIVASVTPLVRVRVLDAATVGDIAVRCGCTDASPYACIKASGPCCCTWEHESTCGRCRCEGCHGEGVVRDP